MDFGKQLPSVSSSPSSPLHHGATSKHRRKNNRFVPPIYIVIVGCRLLVFIIAFYNAPENRGRPESIAIQTHYDGILFGGGVDGGAVVVDVIVPYC